MGHETVLVIGDNFRDQLDKYQRAEYASPANRHLVAVDCLEEAEQEFSFADVSFLQDADGGLHDPCETQFFRRVNGENQQYVPIGFTEVRVRAKGRMSFLDWIKKVNGYGILTEHQARDVDGKHKLGWTRVNAAGEVVELFGAGIPGGFFDWFSSTENSFKLKPGASGIAIGRDGEETITNDFAGSATKAAIDFAGMREVMRTTAAERWDRAVAASGSQSWESFAALWKNFENQRFSLELRNAVARQWAEQPAVKAILDDCRILPGSAIRLAAPAVTGIIETSQIDDPYFEQMTEFERCVASLVWDDHSEHGIDPLALPRGQYVQRFTLWHLLGYNAIIKDGDLLGKFDEIQLFDSLSDETVLTLARVHS